MGLRRTLFVTAATLSAMMFAACGSSDSGSSHIGSSAAVPGGGIASSAAAPSVSVEAPSLAGTWASSDGETKVFSESGACKGAFYAGGKPLDIGGPMSCQLSSKPVSSGRYQLMVRQDGNRATDLVEFKGSDEATVYTKTGQLLYTITRF